MKINSMTDEIKKFINWLHEPKCPFSVCYNGIDKTRPRIEYEKGNKHYNIDEVFDYWKSVEK